MGLHYLFVRIDCQEAKIEAKNALCEVKRGYRV